MRRETDYFGDEELNLVYVARTLREALKVENILTEAGWDYLVETGTYTAGFLIKRDLTGAFFYVAPEDTVQVHATLTANDYRPYDAGRDGKMF